MPSWFDDEPILPNGLGFVTRAFWELSTERQLGMNVGPIPASKIRECGERLGFDFGMLDAFIHLIRAMDSRYLKHVEEERKKLAPKKTKGRRKK